MGMKVLYGQELINELSKIIDSASRRLWIAVPYISPVEDVKKILGTKWINNKSISVKLLADTNEFSNYNSKAIELFYQTGEVKTLPGLHAKIYIIDDTCLITSANLTRNAFTKRHEIGVFLDKFNAESTISIFNEWWEKSVYITQKDFKNIQLLATDTPHEPGTGLPQLWQLNDGIDEVSYWLKPIGSTEAPLRPNRLFIDTDEALHFSKRKPTGIHVADIFIGYAVGDKRLLSVFKSYMDYEKVEVTESNNDWAIRYPWYVMAKNLTLNYGKNWSKHSLFASDLVKEYLTTNPESFITFKGGKTLGALSRGADKIQLNPHFAQFLIKKIEFLDKTDL